MQDSDKIKMRIKIAGMSIPLNVAFKDQDHVRDTEAKISEIFESWRRMFPSKSVEELLAMLTYQYASHYFALENNREKIADQLLAFEKVLDKAVLETD